MKFVLDNVCIQTRVLYIYKNPFPYGDLILTYLFLIINPIWEKTRSWKLSNNSVLNYTVKNKKLQFLTSGDIIFIADTIVQNIEHK